MRYRTLLPRGWRQWALVAALAASPAAAQSAGPYRPLQLRPSYASAPAAASTAAPAAAPVAPAPQPASVLGAALAEPEGFAPAAAQSAGPYRPLHLRPSYASAPAAPQPSSVLSAALAEPEGFVPAVAESDTAAESVDCPAGEGPGAIEPVGFGRPCPSLRPCSPPRTQHCPAPTTAPQPLPGQAEVPQPQPQQQLDFGPQNQSYGSASGPQSVAPYMLGDTSGGGCGGLFINGALVVSVAHPTFACSRLNIAENNSPIPHDRAYFSMRHFHNASDLNIFGNSPGGGQAAFDIYRYTLGVERMVSDRSSIEIRLPVNSQMNSDLSFSQFTGQPANLPLRDYGTELGNISAVFKSMIWQNGQVFITGGAAMNIPTAPDVKLNGQIDDDAFPVGTATLDVLLDFQGRVRNQTVNLSPFLAAVYRPNDTWFSQGFMQIDLPLNESRTSLALDVTVDDGANPPVSLAIDREGRLSQQSLLRLNYGVGAWVYQDTSARWLNGVALMAEAHYTTTLNDAEILGPFPVAPAVPAIGVNATQLAVGNLNNRSDVFNVAFAMPLRMGRTSVTPGVVIPVHCRCAFDFEYNLFVNREF